VNVRFAPLPTRALDGMQRELPAELPAERTLVLLAYRQRHQRDVDEWIALAVALGVPATPRGAVGPMVTAVVEVPFLAGVWRPARRLIDGGMAQGIADPDVLARTLTAYGAPLRHRRACGLDDPRPREVDAREADAREVDGRAEVEALVVERSGTVLWRASGRPTTTSPPGPPGLVEALRPHG
jgi:hypothetical protein